MILNVEIENYRSFKDRVEFSLIAETSKVKCENIYNHIMDSGESIRILKLASIFGANGSGKTTMFRAIYEIQRLIVNNTSKVGSVIGAYDPFLFNEETYNKPCKFAIEFIGKKNIKYRYELEYGKNKILHEKLESYATSRGKLLLSRYASEDDESKKHIGYIGAISQNKKIELFHNRTLLSKFGDDIPDEELSEIFLYFQNIEIVNANNSKMLNSYHMKILDYALENSDFLDRLNKLIRHADTGLNKVIVNKIDTEDIDLPEEMSEEAKSRILANYKYKTISLHDYYRGSELDHKEEPLLFSEESTGTKTLFILGGLLLKSLQSGSPIFVDEINTSLHPYLVKLLISLFQSEKINVGGAQLIFTSHDINVLDKSILRRDQIWFTEKNKEGVTDFFSLQDYSDVRESTSFDRWYLAGKFGALPDIKNVENLFYNEEQ